MKTCKECYWSVKEYGQMVQCKKLRVKVCKTKNRQKCKHYRVNSPVDRRNEPFFDTSIFKMF